MVLTLLGRAFARMGPEAGRLMPDAVHLGGVKADLISHHVSLPAAHLPAMAEPLNLIDRRRGEVRNAAVTG